MRVHGQSPQQSSRRPGTPRNSAKASFTMPALITIWELDLFGHVRRSVQAATADVVLSKATRQDVLVSLTAGNWAELF